MRKTKRKISYIDTFKSAAFTVTKIATNTYKLEKVPRSMPQVLLSTSATIVAGICIR